ncbi:DUF6526 family protein [Chryseobacterium gambrini]|uniref:DUF6526 family protein n=1 Tax=Chryseobacterium gambrini TaxID=373672 RepID=A0AAJ1R896_9FLAO|nr:MULTISPECIES: DUF6526 family protein [Chryseobacterium]MDN4014082.1 DUF6526 family protein [Chryseobacterium gambrini]MDN4028135.1 DUF6526 family protein [Chryseobacterium gambrini]QWA39849.1 hypothetical protein KKI44_06475 [Chryseobacterium sp. ZHDP1]
MESQNYKNHRKFYPPHHFIYLPLLLGLEIFGVYKIFKDETNQLIWILFSAVIFLLFYLAIMLRQHYALVLQNRLVRLEFKQRYYELFQQRSDEVESRLKFDQIAALRFSYDDEFKELLYKALNDNISGDEIKRSIKKWRPDHHRV